MTESELPVVSVIIAMHNSSDTIGRALSSITAQTHTQWQVIVVDDASSDGSAEVVKQFIGEHPDADLQLIKLTENVGAGAARNDARSSITGHWFCFLDADDEFEPWFFKTMLAALDGKDQADVAVANHTIIQADGVSRVRGPKVTGERAGRAALEHLLTDEYTPYFWDKFYRRDTLGAIPIPALRQAEDAAYNIEAFAASRVVITVDQPGTRYFVSPQSLTWNSELEVGDSQQLMAHIREAVDPYWEHSQVRKAFSFSNVLTYLNSINIVSRKYRSRVRRAKIRARTANFSWLDLMHTTRRSLFIGASGIIAKLLPDVYAFAYGWYASKKYAVVD